jgi:Protein of unknown function (DUF2889)
VPLPPPAVREELHLRRVELRGYRRHDALYEIDARITDTKSQPLTLERGAVLPPGAPLHDMWIRLVFDEDLMVHDAIAVTDAAPFGICREAVDSLAQLKGMRIGAGWTAAVKQRLAGAVGCTHLTELLIPLGTTAFQTLTQVRSARPVTLNAQGRPAKIDSCYAYGSQREVVKRRWPEHYDGPERE